MAYVQKKGKTTGKPTADVHAARWRAFRARQRERVTEREEKVMTDISDEEAREAWARSEAGNAAAVAMIREAEEWRIALRLEEASAFSHAAHLAYLDACDEAEPPQEADGPGHDHRWLLLGVQEAAPLLVLPHRPQPRTAVLVRCRVCGLPDAHLLPGAWSFGDLTESWFHL